jgi:Rrf2 family protein
MILPQTAEYALRAMVCLATAEPGQPMLARDLSELTAIPIHYLAKILRRLVLAELLESKKGFGGGFVLARAPETISFRDILQAVDSDPVTGHCAFGWGQCDSARPCPMHDAWAGMARSFQEWAEQTTLAQIRPGAPESYARRFEGAPVPPTGRSTG